LISSTIRPTRNTRSEYRTRRLRCSHCADALAPVIRLIEKRKAEHEAKKVAAGKVVVGKSSVILEVKPWDDETGACGCFRLQSIDCAHRREEDLIVWKCRRDEQI
jgi:hypothetical protein